MLQCTSFASARSFIAVASLTPALLFAAPASAIFGGTTVGFELLVEVDSVLVGTAAGGPDASTNTPLDILVFGGETIDLTLRMTAPPVVLRDYDTAISVNATDLSFVSGTDLSGLGFDAAADPNTTLADASPGTGDADAIECVGEVGCPDPTDPLYTLQFTVVPGFTSDAIRDLSISVDGLVFANPFDSLDAAADTVSIRLTNVPEPTTGALVLAGLLGLAGRRRT